MKEYNAKVHLYGCGCFECFQSRARTEADFYKAQYEALKEKLNEAQTALMKIEEVFVDGENNYEDWRTMGNIAREALEKQND